MLSESLIIYLEEKDWMNDIKIKGIFLKSFLNQRLKEFLKSFLNQRLKEFLKSFLNHRLKEFLKNFMNRDSLTKYICKITQMRLKFGNYGKTPRNRNSP